MMNFREILINFECLVIIVTLNLINFSQFIQHQKLNQANHHILLSLILMPYFLIMA